MSPVLRIRSATVKVGDEVKTYMQGDDVPAKVAKGMDPADFVPSGQTVEQATGTAPSVAPDPLSASTEDLAKWLAESKAKAPEVVALATPEGAEAPDPDRARAILAAENLRSGQDPRTTVVEPLQKVVDADDVAKAEAASAAGGQGG